MYVGKHQTDNLDDGYMGSGKNIRAAIKLYGVENFHKEILFVFDNEAEMNQAEAEIVTEEFILRDDTYNLCIGGQGGFSHINKNVDMSAVRHQNGKNSTNHVQNFNSESHKKSKETLSANLRSGKTQVSKNLIRSFSPEVLQKISEKASICQKGVGNSQFGSMWITDGINSKKIKKDVDHLPEGWYKGRK
jgi:hypothetical protein